MLDWQLIVVGLCVAGAVLFLVRRVADFLRGASGCSTGCGGCGSKKPGDDDDIAVFVPLDTFSAADETSDS